MEQNKGLNIALLAAVFAVSLAAGYFLAQVIVKPNLKVENVVVPDQNNDQDDESVYETIDSTEYYDSLILALEAEEAAAKAAAAEVAVEEVVEPVKYRLFTQSMMQDFLDQKDWGLRPTDSKEIFLPNMIVNIDGVRPGEIPPTTLNQVVSNLENGIDDWDRAIVLKVYHNDINQITKVDLRVQYKDDESYEE